jgi:MoxR-like ATPase
LFFESIKTVEKQMLTQTDTKFIWGPRLTSILHDIKLAVSIKLPILLEGPPGVGKTSLIEEAFAQFGTNDS